MNWPHMIMGTTREHYIMLFGAAGCVALVAGLAGAWVGAYFGARRAVRNATLVSANAQQNAAQLAPMMQALDAIALEVERISEAQRFQARMMSDRPAGYIRAELRSITPH